MGFIANALNMNSNRFQGKQVQRQKLFSGINALANMTKFAAPVNIASKIMIGTGALHKITDGKSTKFFKGLTNLISPNKGIQQNTAQQVRESGKITNAQQLSNALRTH